MQLQHFFDSSTFTLTYLIWDESTKDAAVIDLVLNYDTSGSICSLESVEQVSQKIREHDLNLQLIIETHAHADHLSGGQWLKKNFPQAKTVIGKNITSVQETFKKVFNWGDEFKTDGSQFDELISDGQEFSVGTLSFKAIHNPGHTDACYSFLVENCLFTGDALFMPDFGVARCDFPGGSAETLYQSITQKLYSLPDQTRTFTGHDYQPGGRELLFESTIGEQKKSNVHLNAQTKKEDFISFRNQRDSNLSAPKLLYPSLQINICAGHLPEPEDNGKAYLKTPISLPL